MNYKYLQSSLSSILLSFLVFAGSHLLAQEASYKVEGQLIDAQTQEPLPFATVRLFTVGDSSLATGETSDIEGKFTIQAPAGKYYAWVDFVGYERKEIPPFEVGRTKPKMNFGKISVGVAQAALEEVEVVADKLEMEYQLDKRVYNVSSNVSSLGANATQLLDNVPSVQVDAVEGTVSLRGSQNVRILIDGKPAALSGMSSVEALRNLQTDMIESIEVVTNPSARYEAEGEAGVINIVLKKNKKKGINGSFSANWGHPLNTGASASINFRRNKFNFFGSYGISYRTRPGGGSSLQRFIEEDTSYYYERDRSHDRKSFSQNLRFGLDYYFTPSFNMTLAAIYSNSDENNDVFLNYYDYSEEDVLTQEVGRQQYENEQDNNWSVNFALKKQFAKKRQVWNLDFRASDNQDLELADLYEQNRTFESVPDIEQYSSNTENQRNWLFQTDYVQPFGKKGQMEFGIRGTHRLISNDYLVEQLQEDGSYEPLPDFNNNFEYNEDIWAAYTIIGNSNKKLSWQVGLRAEYTMIGTELKVTGETGEQEYLGLFPSGSFSYNFTETSSLQLSYSRRLSRPRFRLLLPFSNFSDARNFRAGNPNLRPEYAHSFEAGWMETWKSGSLLSSVYYRYRTDVIQRITRVVNGDETISQPVNLALQHAVGFEFAFSQDITKWWNFNANANLYREDTQGTFEGQSFAAEAFSMNGRVSTQLTWRGIDFQTNVRYRAPRVTPQGRRKSITVMDFGASRDLWDGKGTLSFSIRDVFNSRRYRSIIDQPDYYSESEFQWRARQMMLNFSYRLNQKNNRRGGRRGGGRGGDDDGDY